MKQIDPKEFGAFLSEQRREKGLTQKQLAEALHLSPQAVSKWERARSLPDIAVWPQLADALGVTLAELVGCRRMPPEEPLTPVQASGVVESAMELSQTQLNRQRRLAGMLALLLALVIGGGLWFYGSCIAPYPAQPSWFAGSGAVQEGGAEQWQGRFPPHSAYLLGLNAAGKPVFLNPGAALRQIRADCSDAIRQMRQAYALPPLFHFSVQGYGSLGWQLTDGENYVRDQGALLSIFADIYENSFK